MGPQHGLRVGNWAVHDLILPDSYSYSPTPTPTPRLLLPDTYAPTPTNALPTPRLLFTDSYIFGYTTAALLFSQLDAPTQPSD